MHLEGAVCVVTGATEGIGRAIAWALGRRGAVLAVCARTPDRVAACVDELERHDVRAIGSACDVASEASVAAFAALVTARLGAPDVVVNNAGVGFFAPLEQLTVDAFDRTIAVNVRGPFLVTRAFLPEMRRRGAGHIVNVASLAGRNGFPGGTAYTASKHAVLGFSKSLLLEVRSDGIRVITVCPGSVVTPFFDKAGAPLEHPERKLQPDDVADSVVAALELSDRAVISELDIRPSNP